MPRAGHFTAFHFIHREQGAVPTRRKAAHAPVGVRCLTCSGGYLPILVVFVNQAIVAEIACPRLDESALTPDLPSLCDFPVRRQASREVPTSSGGFQPVPLVIKSRFRSAKGRMKTTLNMKVSTA